MPWPRTIPWPAWSTLSRSGSRPGTAASGPRRRWENAPWLGRPCEVWSSGPRWRLWCRRSGGRLGEGEERDDLGPGPAPAWPMAGYFRPQARPRRRRGPPRRRPHPGPIDVLQGRSDRLAVLVGDEVEAVAQQMDDAGLDLASGNTAVIASGKPFSPSTTAIRMSSTPRF